MHLIRTSKCKLSILSVTLETFNDLDLKQSHPQILMCFKVGLGRGWTVECYIHL